MNVKKRLQDAKVEIKKKIKDPRVQMFASYVAVGLALVVSAHYKESRAPRRDEPTFTYSFGVDSILKIQATEEEAEAYNRFQRAFFDAQEDFLQSTGKKWAVGFLRINASDHDRKIFNAIGKRVNKALKYIDQDETPIEIDDDFLVKN